MTISHAASTGSPVVVNDPAPYDVAYVGVAAGRMGILFATIEPDTSAFTTGPSAWTFLGELAGGAAGIGGSDDSPSRVGAWYKVFTGSESGSVTFTNGAPNGGTGCMSVYSTTAGGWATPIIVSGTDNAHAGNRSVTCGAWASTLAAGDWVTWGFASETDTAVTITAPTITQSGATFGTVTQRNRTINSNANDTGSYSFDASVTAGSANAPTVAFTTATAQCGPAIVVRLREASGASNVTGAATAAFTFNAPASGKRTVKGAATAAFTFNGPVVGKRTVKGSAAAAFTFNAPAVGRRTVKGSTTAAFIFNAPVSGRRTVKGSAAAPFTFNAPAGGTRKVLGSAAALFTFNAPAAGGVDGAVEGSTTAAFTFNAPAVGRRTVKGSAAAGFTFNAPAVGRRRVLGTTAAAFTFNAPASGRRTVRGSALAALTFNAPASGGEVGNVARAAMAAAVIARRTAVSEATDERVADSGVHGPQTASSDAGSGHLADSAVTARRTEAAAVAATRTQTSGVS